MRDLLAATFRQIPDKRAPERTTWQLHAVLMSAFAMFFFQHPSLLEYQRRMRKAKGRSNLDRVFEVEDIPSDTQMREILDGVPTEPLRQLFPVLFERLRRTGWTVRFVTKVNEVNYYTLAFDGSQYFSSSKIQCAACLQRKDSNGQVHYSHIVVSATLVKAGTHDILPLAVEEVRNTAGQEKQDCELNAGKRLLQRIRREHPQLRICVTGDDLYAHEPFIQYLREARMAFVLIAKASAHPELFEWVEELDRLGECEKGEWTEGPAARRRFFKYRIAQQVPLTQSGAVIVKFVEVLEYNRAGQEVYHNSFVTDFAVTGANVAVVAGIGRSRWKIENEQFNVHKNQGYELEHNYGHGRQTLSLIFYLLNLLAFVLHRILEWGDALRVGGRRACAGCGRSYAAPLRCWRWGIGGRCCWPIWRMSWRVRAAVRKRASSGRSSRKWPGKNPFSLSEELSERIPVAFANVAFLKRLRLRAGGWKCLSKTATVT